MNDSINSTPNTEHAELGRKLINRAIDLLAWGVATAVAWSCSTVMLGIIMFIIMAVVMFLLAGALKLVLLFKVSNTTAASLGAAVGGVTGRISALFTRKAVA